MQTCCHLLFFVSVCLASGLAAEPSKSAKAAAAEAVKRDIARYGVSVASSKDGTPQKAIFYCPPEATPDNTAAQATPLLVALHTWSGGYEQGVEHVSHAKKRKWVMVAPDFRGKNVRPEACASDLAVQDVLDAVEFAKKNARVDTSRIYVVGSSGGGHMSLMMASRAPQLWAGVSAWVPISDLAAWHAESLVRKGRYATMLEQCCGGPPSAQTEVEYRKRSPLFHLAVAKGLPLDINVGIHDGYTGSVPVTQSLRAFNVLAVANGCNDRQVSEEQMACMLRERKVPPLLAKEREHDPERQREVLFRRVAGAARITVFEGGHDSELSASLDWLSRQRRGEPPDFRLGKGSSQRSGAREVSQ